MSTRELPLLQAAEEYGSFDIVIEAAGASSVTQESHSRESLESMQALRRNGVLAQRSGHSPGGGTVPGMA